MFRHVCKLWHLSSLPHEPDWCYAKCYPVNKSANSIKTTRFLKVTAPNKLLYHEVNCLRLKPNVMESKVIICVCVDIIGIFEHWVDGTHVRDADKRPLIRIAEAARARSCQARAPRRSLTGPPDSIQVINLPHWKGRRVYFSKLGW